MAECLDISDIRKRWKSLSRWGKHMEICFTNCTCVFLEQLQISFDYCFLKRIKRVCILLIHHTFFMVTLDFLSVYIDGSFVGWSSTPSHDMRQHAPVAELQLQGARVFGKHQTDQTVTTRDNRAQLHIYEIIWTYMIIWLWYTAWTWNRWINYNISAIGSQLAVASCQHCGKKWMPPCLQYKNTPLQRSNCNFSFWRLVTWGCQCSWCRQEQCRWRFAGSEKVPQRCL